MLFGLFYPIEHRAPLTLLAYSGVTLHESYAFMVLFLSSFQRQYPNAIFHYIFKECLLICTCIFTITTAITYLIELTLSYSQLLWAFACLLQSGFLVKKGIQHAVGC